MNCFKVLILGIIQVVISSNDLKIDTLDINIAQDYKKHLRRSYNYIYKGTLFGSHVEAAQERNAESIAETSSPTGMPISYGSEVNRALCAGGAGLNGSNWDCSDESVNPCSSGWAGVSCDDLGLITSFICTSSMYLSGIIPSSIGTLTTLTQISISTFCGVGGTIPDSIGALSNLQSLEIKRSPYITGTIPTAIGQLQSLTSLELQSLRLLGTIPESIGQLTNLQTLVIALTYITGAIPSSIGSLTGLQSIILSDNSLKSRIPSTIGALSSLTVLRLQGNFLSSSLPSEIGFLTNLTSLSLSDNSLSSSIPNSIGNMRALVDLSLYRNKLTGPIPSQIGQLVALSRFLAFDNSLSFSIPKSTGNMAALVDLELYNNKLTGSIPSEISKATALTTLDLHGNSLTAAIPPSVGSLIELYYLVLSDNSLASYIPSSIGNCTNLRTMDLSVNNLKSSIPGEIGLLTDLGILDLHANSISGPIPWGMGEMMSLSALDLSKNRLTSSLPTSIGSLTSLVTLNLNSNSITSSIPSAVGHLTMLSALDLADNQLMGTIPAEIGQLGSLIALHLNTNNLVGAVPKGIGNLVLLTSLYLNSNSLTSSIPAELGTLGTVSGNMIIIDLSDNFLTSSIPIEIGTCSMLEELDLSSNRLSGSLALVTLFPNLDSINLKHFDVHNNKLTGTVPPQLSVVTTLTYLDLSSNKFTKSISAEIFQGFQSEPSHIGLPPLGLKNLTHLDLSSNQLTGEILYSVSHCFQLRELYLSSNNFEDKIFPDFGFALPALSKVHLDNNKFSGTISKVFKYAPDLFEFFAQNTSLCYDISLTSLVESGQLNIPITSVCIPAVGVMCDLLAGFANTTSLTRGWKGCGNSSSPVVCGGEWQGVTCDSSNNIVELNLANLSLTGTISRSIGNLPSLTLLDLSSNRLTGEIPEEISLLSNLQTLSIASNQLGKRIPSTLFTSMSSLGALDLSNNALTGPLPPTVGDWVLGVKLDLSSNGLSGYVPDSFGKLKLASCDLSSNMFSGPFPNWPGSSKGNYGLLQQFYLSNNSFTGSLPVYLGQYYNLVILDVSSNSFTSSIPASINGISSVVRLDISANRLRSSIPRSMGSLTKLRILYLSQNSLQYMIPSELGYLSSLVALRLNNNNLTSSIPSELGKLVNLEQLYLFSNSLESSIPTAIGLLSSLNILQLGGNRLNSLIPSSIGLLSTLNDLGMGGNMLTGSLPLSFFNLTQLSNLLLHSNKLTGVISTSIGQLRALTALSLHDNSLRSSIPSSVGYLTNLFALQLQKNNLSSSIPTAMGALSSLQVLYLQSNKLTSSIPQTLGLLNKMVYLDLSSNLLRNQVPSSLLNMTRMQQLLLNMNRLTGEFPVGICSIKSMKLLTLSNNSLLCSPWCQFDANWNSGVVFPRCADVSDKVLMDLENSLEVVSAMQKQVYSTSRILMKAYPPSTQVPVTLIEDANAFAYVVQVTTNGPICSADVTFCADAACQQVIGRVQGNNWILPTLAPSAPQLLHVNSKRFYYQVSAFTQTPPGDLCQGRFGFVLTITTRATKPLTWTFGSIPYKSRIASKAVINLDGNLDGQLYQYANGLCQTPWTGIVCSKGQIIGLSLKALALSGSIPTSIGLLTGLTSLDLSANMLTGKLASTLGLLTKLDTLVLSGNKLNGTVPTSLSGFPGLYQCDLSANSLSGSVPSFFGGMRGLGTLYLDSNQFSNEVPSELCAGVVGHNLTVTLTKNPRLTCYQEDCWESQIAIVAKKKIFDESLRMCVPTFSPTMTPTGQPTDHPTTVEPTSNPSVVPSRNPSTRPSAQPTPTFVPSMLPSTVPTTVPTLVPSNRPTKAIVIIQPLLTEQETIIVSSTVVISFISFISLVLCWRRYCTKEAKRRIEAEITLKFLPVHYALLKSKSLSNEALANLITTHEDTVNKKDFEGNTVLDLILQKKTKLKVSQEIVYMLLKDSLPLKEIATGEPIDDVSHTHGWIQCIQSEDESVCAAVEQLLNNFRAPIQLLAYCTDSTGRRAIDLAEPHCKTLIFRKLYFHERYELKEGPPEHQSLTSLVIFARDHKDNVNSGVVKLVALKFMKHRDKFLKEVNVRSDGGFDARFVLPIICSYDGDSGEPNDRAFREGAILMGYQDYKYCVVMEAASHSLMHAIDHDQFVGQEWDRIKIMSKQLASALDHVHSKEIVHGDIKSLNVLMVGNHLKLTDLDAACNMAKGECAGDKYSSGYLAPELLLRDATDGTVRVRSRDGLDAACGQYELLPAHPSQDMWALGCVLYTLCCGATLFAVNTSDNISFADDLEILYEWTPEMKEKKLRLVQDKLAKNLIALLLSKDPVKRPSASRVLSHPFLTGHSVVRLQGEDADWDVFLSYRVASDSDHVEMLYNALIEKKLKVWWDKLCLLPGQNWEEGFCSGLVNSATFVCLLSRGAINHPDNDRQNFTKLKKDSRCDNVLLEWRLALELKERDMIEGVFPVMIGDKDPTTGLYSNYFAGCHPNACPDIAVDSVELKLREHLDREGLGLPYKEENTVKNIVTTVTANQGGFLRGDAKDAIPPIVAAVIKMREVVRAGVVVHSEELVVKNDTNTVIEKLEKTITDKDTELANLKDAKDRELEDKYREIAVLKDTKDRELEDKDREIAVLKDAKDRELEDKDRENAELRQLLGEARRRVTASTTTSVVEDDNVELKLHDSDVEPSYRTI